MNTKYETQEVAVCANCMMMAANGEEIPDWGDEPLTLVPDGWDLIPGDGEGYFSWSRCDTCDGLPGNRYDATLMTRYPTHEESEES